MANGSCSSYSRLPQASSQLTMIQLEMLNVIILETLKIKATDFNFPIKKRPHVYVIYRLVQCEVEM